MLNNVNCKTGSSVQPRRTEADHAL